MLEAKGIRISAFCKSIGDVEDKETRTIADADASKKYPTRACTEELDAEMNDCIMAARKDADSVGGVVECIIEGLPIGFGGIWFKSLDAELAGAMFGIPACKGVEFGKGFDITRMHGSQSNDAYRFDSEGKIITKNSSKSVNGREIPNSIVVTHANTGTGQRERTDRSGENTDEPEETDSEEQDE